MKLNLFTLCEGAFNHNGHLTIVNTIDFINCDLLPYRISQFAIAVKVDFDQNEMGTHQMKLLCTSAVGDELPLVDTSIDIAQAKESTLLCLSINLSNFQFVSMGLYVFKLIIDDSKLGEVSLKVNKKE